MIHSKVWGEYNLIIKPNTIKLLEKLLIYAYLFQSACSRVCKLYETATKNTVQRFNIKIVSVEGNGS